MKQLLFAGLFVLSLAAFAGCNKTYYCECYTNGTTLLWKYEDGEDAAKRECDNHQATLRVTDASAICEIK